MCPSDDPSQGGWSGNLLGTEECTFGISVGVGDLARHDDAAAMSEGKGTHLFNCALHGFFQEVTHHCLVEFHGLDHVSALTRISKHPLCVLRLVFCRDLLGATYGMVDNVKHVFGQEKGQEGMYKLPPGRLQR